MLVFVKLEQFAKKKVFSCFKSIFLSSLALTLELITCIILKRRSNNKACTAVNFIFHFLKKFQNREYFYGEFASFSTLTCRNAKVMD